MAAAVNPDQIAVDIGSTIIKIASLGDDDASLKQVFEPRDFELGIAAQVQRTLAKFGTSADNGNILVCSSANGGLRIGIVSLTDYYSGAVLRNQALSAGANPLFVDQFESSDGNLQSVDVLLVAGGIDCPDAGPLAQRLERFRTDLYHFNTLVYAGNRYLAQAFVERNPGALVIDNPLATGLRSTSDSVFETLRRAYLDDLVHTEGISDLRIGLSGGVRPTPEVVNRGFHRAVLNRSSIEVPGSCILIDIGGATTDLHYTVEIIVDESDDRPAAGSSVARYVFTDLGIVFSRDSTLAQMRNHPRIYDFLTQVIDGDVREVYRLLRESDYDPEPDVLSYACLFLALDRFAQGKGPGLPQADLSKVSQFILTGGASQNLNELQIRRLLALFIGTSSSNPGVEIDRDYRIWVEGITWMDSASN